MLGPLYNYGIFCLDWNMSFANQCVRVFILVMALAIYALAIEIRAVKTISEPFFKRKWVKVVSVLAFVVFDVVFLIYLSAVKKKNRGALLLSVLSALLVLPVLLVRLKAFQLVLPYLPLISILILLFKYCAVVLLNGSFTRKCAISLIPVALGVLFIILGHMHTVKAKQNLSQMKQRISEKLEYSLDFEDFLHDVIHGFSPEEEPMKCLLEQTDEMNREGFPPDGAGIEEVKQSYADFCAKYPEFIQAVKAFRACPLESVAHQWKANVFDIELPELRVFRTMAKYLVLEIKANPGEKEQILSLNKELMRLRDINLNNRFLITRLVGIAIEGIRLNALAYALPYAKFTKAELDALIGESPDFNRHIACAIVDEAIVHDYLINVMLQTPEYWIDECDLSETQARWVVFSRTNRWNPLNKLFDNDALFFIQGIDTYINYALTPKRNYSEMEQYEEQLHKNALRKGAIFSTMLMPSISRTIEKVDRIGDMRRMLLTAYQIVEYKERTAELPDSLRVLGDIPVDSVNHLHFQYTHGTLTTLADAEEDQRSFDGFCLAIKNHPRAIHLYVPMP